MTRRLRVGGTILAVLVVVVLLAAGFQRDLQTLLTPSQAQTSGYAAATKAPWNVRQVNLPAILTKEPGQSAVFGLQAIRLKTPAPVGHPAGTTQIGLLWAQNASILLQPWQGEPQVLMRAGPPGDHTLAVAASPGSQGTVVLLDDTMQSGGKQRFYWWNLSTGEHEAFNTKAPWPFRAFHTATAWTVTGGADAGVYSLGILPIRVLPLPNDLYGAAVFGHRIFGSWRGSAVTYDWQSKTFVKSAVQAVHHVSLAQNPGAVALLGSWGPTFVLYPHGHAVWPNDSLVLAAANGLHRYQESLAGSGGRACTISVGSDYIVKSNPATAQFWIGWVTKQGRFLWHYGGRYSSGPHHILFAPTALAHHVVWVAGQYTYVWRAPE